MVTKHKHLLLFFFIFACAISVISANNWWTFKTEDITDSSFRHDKSKIVTVLTNKYGKKLNFQQVLRRWTKSSKNSGFNRNFQHFFKILAQEDPDFRHVFFELPPLNKKTLKKPAEFILIEAPIFKTRVKDVRYDIFASKHHLPQCKRSTACNFPNRSGNAVMIVPKGDNNMNNDRYTDLMSFAIKASEKEFYDLFKKVGQLSLKEIKKNPQRPTWISTHGLGVIWLHVRLDTIPKYYDWLPYKNANFFD